MSCRDHLSFFDKYSIEHKQSGSDETLLRDKQTGGYVLMKEVLVESNEQYKVIIETLEGQRCLRHEHLLSLIDYEIRSEEKAGGICRKVITFFQYSKHTLEDEIEARLREERPFEQTQLWSLLCSPTLGLAYLQKQNVGHGCVSPIDIFLTHEGIIKIADPSIATTSPLDCVEGYYYSPQMIQKHPDIDVFRSDIWSLAMCTLQAALLEPCDDCYDYQEGRIIYEILQERLDRLSEGYSQQFIDVLMLMLNIDPTKRPNFIELQQHLIQLMNPSDESTEQMSQSQLKSSSYNMKSIAKSTMRDNLPVGLRTLEEDKPDVGSAIQQYSQQHDQESVPDKNDEDHSEQKIQSMDINITANIGQNGETQTHVVHIQTQRMSANELADQIQTPQNNRMSNLTQHKKDCTSLYESRGFRPSDPGTNTRTLLSQSRIPMSITTSKYEQQNCKDTMNVSNRASIVLEIDKLTGLKPGTQMGVAVIPTSSHILYDPKPFEPQRQGYSEWNGYIYKPSNDQLFTDPKLLQMMKSDLQRIKAKQEATTVSRTGYMF